jgi:hypothetical protein
MKIDSPGKIEMWPREARPLDAEIREYEARQSELERLHWGKFVVFHDGELVGTFENFDSAARDAIKLFGRGPYLIRKVGASTTLDPDSLTHISLPR